MIRRKGETEGRAREDRTRDKGKGGKSQGKKDNKNGKK